MVKSTYPFVKVSFSKPRSVAPGTLIKNLKWESFSKGTIQIDPDASAPSILIEIKQGPCILLSRTFTPLNTFPVSNKPFRKITYTAKQAAFRYDLPNTSLNAEEKSQEPFQISFDSTATLASLIEALRSCFIIQPMGEGKISGVRSILPTPSQLGSNNARIKTLSVTQSKNNAQKQASSPAEDAAPPKKKAPDLTASTPTGESQQSVTVVHRSQQTSSRISPASDNQATDDSTSDLKRALLRGFKPLPTATESANKTAREDVSRKDIGNKVQQSASLTGQHGIVHGGTIFEPSESLPRTQQSSPRDPINSVAGDFGMTQSQLLVVESQIQGESQLELEPTLSNRTQAENPAPQRVSNIMDLITFSPIPTGQNLVQLGPQTRGETPASRQLNDTSSGSYVTAVETLEQYPPLMTDEAQRARDHAKKQEDDLELEDEATSLREMASPSQSSASHPNALLLTLNDHAQERPVTLPYGRGIHDLHPQDLKKIVEDVLMENGFQTLCVNVGEILATQLMEQRRPYYYPNPQVSYESQQRPSQDAARYTHYDHSLYQQDTRYLEVEHGSQQYHEQEYYARYYSPESYERSGKRRRIDGGDGQGWEGFEAEYDDLDDEDGK
ncbi:hypothetical protein CI109_102660 [Kwoniella shandongensis]|uniref:Uncharacterized protein n=1 Tax=Kwoniella shandongensis TaxID=1734106 RepID=A0A5M6BWG0_9TREE|nr:uncharacterized protein CI109_005240 [Kwoniella shandongensis]KAA5526470.1 hypothetical protein CI109_005240 [Kwoniella shandongensis]